MRIEYNDFDCESEINDFIDLNKNKKIINIETITRDKNTNNYYFRVWCWREV